MILRVRIPNSYQKTVANVKQLILLSERLGFDMQDLTVEESNGTVIELHNLNEVLRISTDLKSSVDLNSNYKLFYFEGLNLHATHVKPVPGEIYLDLPGQLGFVDLWATSSKAKFSSYARSTIVDVDWHLSWFIVATMLEFPVEDALMLARAGCVSRETWPNDVALFPTPIVNLAEFNHTESEPNQPIQFPTITEQLGLYPVVPSVDWIEKLLIKGVKTLQLRIKQPDLEQLEQQIARAVELGKKYQAKVFINDYWQLAIKHGAYGVHLGQEDIVSADLNAIANSKLHIGISTHGYYEILRIAQFSPSYIALGHIFPTTTKQMPSKPQGLIRLGLYQQVVDSIANRQSRIPTVAIGGIDQTTASEVWQCGVDSLAVVRAITEVDDISDAIARFGKVMEIPQC